MRKAPSAGARGTAEASARYLLDHVKQILAVDRSKDIQASVEVLTSAKKLVKVPRIPFKKAEAR